MKVQIREVQLEDATALSELNHREMGYDFSAAETQEKLCRLSQSSRDKIFVAVTQGQIVGYVHASDYDVIYAPRMKNIMGIAVSAQYKRQGIGTSLLCAVEAWARQTGAYGVRLVSGASRTSAHEFYRHCGYGGERQQVNFKKLFENRGNEGS